MTSPPGRRLPGPGRVARRLRRGWDKVIRHDVHYVSWEFIDAGFGVAVAIRAFD